MSLTAIQLFAEANWMGCGNVQKECVVSYSKGFVRMLSVFIFLLNEQLSCQFSSLFLQVKPSQKAWATQRNVSPARSAQVYCACILPALTPPTPFARATMVSTWMKPRRNVYPALSVLKVRECCTAVKMTVTQSVRIALGTPTRTRKAFGSLVFLAVPVMRWRS